MSRDGIRPHRAPRSREEAEALRLAQEAAPTITRDEAEAALGVQCTGFTGGSAELDGQGERPCRRPAGHTGPHSVQP